MAKLNYLSNGKSVTDQVVCFQTSRDDDDYLPIKLYYEDFKDIWFKQLSDYLDRPTFESDFDFKLCRAVDTFNEEEARKYARNNGWSFVGMFNRWFYRILTNWKSNVKTSSFRIKKRPAIICPVCGRSVGKIDEKHLQHYKTMSDLPKYMTYKGRIYQVASAPGEQIVTYGKYKRLKLEILNSGKAKEFADEKEVVKYPWGNKVVCPFTKKLVPALTEEYIKSLPNQYSRYAQPFSWFEFIEEYPSALIQSEIYSLDFISDPEEGPFADHVDKDMKSPHQQEMSTLDQIRSQKVRMRFDDIFSSIDEHVDDECNREILKLIAVGYSSEDIADSLNLQKSEVRKRIRYVRDSARDLEKVLMELV